MKQPVVGKNANIVLPFDELPFAPYLGHCGSHTGEVLAGNVGTEFRDQFTALGPNVNLASRIEARSASGQILLSQSTSERVKADCTLKPAGEIEDVKNIPGKFSLYTV